ncbi:unnamed protein product, partial [Tetraodon nigroviridis]
VGDPGGVRVRLHRFPRTAVPGPDRLSPGGRGGGERLAPVHHVEGSPGGLHVGEFLRPDNLLQRCSRRGWAEHTCGGVVAGSGHGHRRAAPLLHGQGGAPVGGRSRRRGLRGVRGDAGAGGGCTGLCLQSQAGRPAPGAESGLLWHPGVRFREFPCTPLVTGGSRWLTQRLCLQIPNPLFDLAGIHCGHFLVPFWTFFGATLIGKAIIKMHIQKLFVIVTFSKHIV